MSQNPKALNLLSGLQDQGLGEFIEGAFADFAVAHEHDIHEIIDGVILQKKQNQGKGPVVAGGAGGRKSSRAKKASRGGGTTLNVEPASKTFRHESQVSGTSRSIIEPILERRDSATTNGALFTTAAKECRAAAQAIVKQCQSSGRKYFDASFYFDEKGNLFPDGSPSDCTVTQPTHAARLSELYPGAPLFASDVSCDDVAQGQVGDCFLIGAISALAAANPDAVKNLFVASYPEWCVYGFVFFKSGGWEWVIIDDIIATEKLRNGMVPLYASCMRDVELWPMLLEKAYAKIHFNWDIIDGGWAKEALVDMTGGLASTLDLYRREKNLSFKAFKAYVDDPYTILGCAVGDQVEEDSGTSGHAGEAGAAHGLFHGHQYSVVDAKETSDGCGFVQVRNPWGNEAEWSGPYADNDQAWISNPLHKREVNPSFANDGAFWMLWEDFKKYLSCIDVVRLFPEDFKCLTKFGNATEQKTPNNCFILQVADRPTQLSIAFAQDDPKVKFDSREHEQQYDPYQALKLSVFKLRELPDSFEKVESSFHSRLVAVKCRERSVYHYASLDPGLYCIFPTVLRPKGQVGTYLRIFGPPDSDYALWRFSSGEQKKLSVGKCPNVSSPATQHQQEKQQQQRPEQRPSATSPLSASKVEKHQDPAAENELADALAYIKELQKLIREQEEDITTLQSKNTSLNATVKQLQQQQQQQQSREPSPDRGHSASRKRSVSPRRRSPLARLGMSQDQWDTSVSNVFREVSSGQRYIDAETAVNAFRMIVTLGADMDECFLSEHKTRGDSKLLDQSYFADLCDGVVRKWHPLAE